MTTRRFRWSCWMVAVLCAGGCGTTKPSRYYFLSAATPPATQPTARSAVIGITRVTIPAYLDRPQMVTVGDGNRMHFADFDRWAEPLADGCARVLAANLAALLPAYHVRHREWLDKSQLAQTVMVDITRLAAKPGDSVQLSAQWTVQPRGASEPIIGQGAYTVPAGTSYDSLAEAISTALEQLAAEIAQSIRAAPGAES